MTSSHKYQKTNDTFSVYDNCNYLVLKLTLSLVVLFIFIAKKSNIENWMFWIMLVGIIFAIINLIEKVYLSTRKAGCIFPHTRHGESGPAKRIRLTTPGLNKAIYPSTMSITMISHTHLIP